LFCFAKRPDLNVFDDRGTKRRRRLSFVEGKLYYYYEGCYRSKKKGPLDMDIFFFLLFVLLFSDLFSFLSHFFFCLDPFFFFFCSAF